jgi:hypothetical protein
MLRDMRINRIFEGSTEIMHLLIAREALDQHLAVAGDILDPKTALGDKAKAAVGAAKFYAGYVPTLVTGEGQKPNAYDEFGPLAKHIRYSERHARKLARATLGLMGRHQASLEQKGALLGRVVDIGAELFGISATCVYALTVGKREPEHKDEALELADMFAKQARRRADQLFSELFSNDDAFQYKAAQKVLEGRYSWFDSDVLDPAGPGPHIPEHDKPAEKVFEEAADKGEPVVSSEAEKVQ